MFLLLALSPVKGHATTTQDGIYSIRAFNVEENMIRLYDRYQDKHTQATALSLASARWFAVRLDILCAAFILAVLLSCVLTAGSKFVFMLYITLKLVIELGYRKKPDLNKVSFVPAYKSSVL